MNGAKENRGSQWHKWDFHVHTPYSILNNQYPCNPDDTDTSSFDDYVRTLFTKAIEANVSAVGITDYFSVEGYQRIRAEYLDKPEKMEALFPDAELRAQAQSVYVFPNVELRLETFVGKQNRSVNYHVIFSDEVSPEEIEENFLHNLTAPYDAAPGNALKRLSLTRRNIETIGKEYRKHNAAYARGSDYMIGMEKISVRYEDIPRVLKDNFRDDTYLIAIPDDDLSEVSWAGRDYATRHALYQQCHCLLTPNPKTRDWALAKGHETEQIAEFKSIKPCIWGSDAHSYEAMFAPAKNRHCWIKAELSFNGLRQILEEPEDRTRIQEKSPAPDRPHQTIDYIRFHDERFPPEPIYFSDGLTCIIGGKSTGKSVLLRHIANGISPSVVRDRERELQDATEKLTVPAEVVWRDGASGERKIIYIPQSLLNHLADNKSPDSLMNAMIEELLLQDEAIERARGLLQSEAENILSKARHNILDFVRFTRDAEGYEQALNEEGRVPIFQGTLRDLDARRRKLAESAGVTPGVLARYHQLEGEIFRLSEEINALQQAIRDLSSLKTPFAYVVSSSAALGDVTSIRPDGSPFYDFSRMPPVQELLTGEIDRINGEIRKSWDTAYATAWNTCQKKLARLQDRKDALQPEFEELERKVKVNEELKEVERSIEKESQKLIAAETGEKALEKCRLKARELKAAILSSPQELRDAYVSFCESVKSLNASDTRLQFDAAVAVNTDALLEAVNTLFDNRKVRGLSYLSEKDINSDFFKNIWPVEASLKGMYTLQSALEVLFQNWLYVHYTVRLGKDTIDRMSKGQKALVLLEMLIHLEKGHCPILIDQPEDDLDNRSIYSELVQYLKEKKRERQIIVVTHNANVVVGADAEEVIIANQDGKDAPNCEYQFEYRSGAIENNRPVMEGDKRKAGILYQKGIQEQICDILEGGRQAFEKRGSRYWGTNRRT